MTRIKSMSDKELKAFITDELAQKEGYPSAEVYWLEAELTKLAKKWRKKNNAAVVKEYHELYSELLEQDWNPSLLSSQGMLPLDLMPQEFKDSQK